MKNAIIAEQFGAGVGSGRVEVFMALQVPGAKRMITVRGKLHDVDTFEIVDAGKLQWLGIKDVSAAPSMCKVQCLRVSLLAPDFNVWQVDQVHADDIMKAVINIRPDQQLRHLDV